MKITIDNREPLSVVRQIQSHFTDAQIEIEELHCGDIWINEEPIKHNDVVIERKAQDTGDFFESIKDGRLINQAAKMRAITEHCYIVIEGPLIWRSHKMLGRDWHFRSVQGALLTVQELGVCVINCDNAGDFAKTIEWIWKRDRSKITILPPKKYGILITPPERILMTFDSIGPKQAEKLFDKFGSVAAFLEHVTDSTKPLLPGITEKRQRAIKQALGLKTNEKMQKSKV